MEYPTNKRQGHGCQPHPCGPAYLPSLSFLSSFLSSSPNTTTWPPLSLLSSFLSSEYTTTLPPLSLSSPFLSSSANAKVDIVPKLRNATKAINPLNRFMGTSINDLGIVARPCPIARPMHG